MATLQGLRRQRRAFEGGVRTEVALPISGLGLIYAIQDSLWVTLYCVFGAGLLGGAWFEQTMASETQSLRFGGALSGLFVSLAWMGGVYSRSRSKDLPSQIKDIGLVWSAVVACVTVVVWALRPQDSVPWGLLPLPSLLAIPGGLIVLRHLLRVVLGWGCQAGLLRPSQAIVVTRSGRGVGEDAQAAIAACGHCVGRIFPLPEKVDDEMLRGLTQQINGLVNRQRVGAVYLDLDWSDGTTIRKITKYLNAMPVAASLLPQPVESIPFEGATTWSAGRKAVVLLRPPLTPAQRTAKRAMDLVASGLALPALLPLFLCVALAIKLDSPGPVLFRQRRVGLANRQIVVFKFRTMKTVEDGLVIRQAGRNDERVTRVGRFLRKSSLDELPQLLNVFRGDMSLVGPRPHALAHDAEYGRLISSYAARHRVKPGITGWAQVNGCRGATPEVSLMAKRVAHDLWYIDNWSLWLDLAIILRTAWNIPAAENAY